MADINTTIHENLKEDANIDNVVTALSWDLGQVLPGDENNKEMCAILNKMDPTVSHFKMDYKAQLYIIDRLLSAEMIKSRSQK